MEGLICSAAPITRPLPKGKAQVQVCQTLVSTGTKAVFLNPTDALHGDIGIVGQDDLVVIVSKSGATEELLRLVPYAKVALPPSEVFPRSRHNFLPACLEHSWQHNAVVCQRRIGMLRDFPELAATSVVGASRSTFAGLHMQRRGF